ncbi:hypothetical protein LIER_12299 [Lithospermum erythrorhizon]|uniref:Uncharacterized protein n=1 Tax=Lithospermum erythrorhizon TaxID=34254 RepID=A0AAV3PR72_LITER
MEKKDEIAMVLMQFGDEKSTLMDQYERLSFEIQLNQAILGRSLSEPGVSRSRTPLVAPRPLPLPPPPPLTKNVAQGKRGTSTAAVAGFRRVIKKLLKPFVGKKHGKNDDHTTPTPKDHKFHKIFRSMSVKI